MQEAADFVRNEIKSVKESAQLFGVQYSTLQRFINKTSGNTVKNNAHVGYAKPRQVFTSEQEEELVSYPKTAAAIYFGLSPREVKELAYKCSNKAKITMPDNWSNDKCAGKDWFSGFMTRHGQVLSIRKPEATSLARATRFNKHRPNICNLEVDSMNNLEEHPQVHNSRERYQCEICHKILATNYNLTRHKKFNCGSGDDLNELVKLPLGRRNFKCPICSKGFYLKTKLINHMEIHSKGLKFKCDICGKEYIKEVNKMKHLRYCRIESKEKILEKEFKCLICSNKYTTKSGLKRHMNSHPNWKEFTCVHCSEAFAQKIQLEIHMTTAHPEKNTFKCGFCGKEFFKHFKLERHIKKEHTASKTTFKCGSCGKEFVHSWLLRKHMAVHSEPVESTKPKFKCQQCSQTFTKEFHLKQHMLIHNNQVFIDNNSLVIEVDIDATTMSSDPKEDPLAINDVIPPFVKEENTDSELSEETPSSIIKSECFTGSEFPVKLRSISEMNNCISGDVKDEIIKEEH